MRDISTPQVAGLLGVVPLSAPAWMASGLAPLFQNAEQAKTTLHGLSPAANQKGADAADCRAARHQLINSVYCLLLMLGHWQPGQPRPTGGRWGVFRVRQRKSQRLLPLWLVNLDRHSEPRRVIEQISGTPLMECGCIEKMQAALSPEQVAGLNRLHLGVIPDISMIERRKHQLCDEPLDVERELFEMVN